MRSHDNHMTITKAHQVQIKVSFSFFPLRRYLSRNIGFEAVMRIRCTEGTHTLLHPFLLIFLVHLLLSPSLSSYLSSSSPSLSGLSMHTFHGKFFVRSTDLLTLPNVNPDHGFCMNISIDENLKDYNNVCFQAALLYTSYRG